MKRIRKHIGIVIACVMSVISIYGAKLPKGFVINAEATSIETIEVEGEVTNDVDISAASAILVEATTGKVIYENNADMVVSPASITKIMTLMLIFDNIANGKIDYDDVVTTSEYAKSMGGSQVFLETGEQQTVETLIKCIVVASGNDASVCMAEYIAGSEEEFVKMMNERAAGLGMTNTVFLDCCGLNDTMEHHTSARDVAIMSRELITKYPEIYNYSKIWMENITHNTAQGSKEFTLSNTNKLLKQYQWTTGLKTGSTSLAKYCLSATASKDGVDLVAVIMGAPDHKARFSEAQKLLNYGFANVSLYKDNNEDLQSDVSVKNGAKEKVSIMPESEYAYVCGKGENVNDIRKEINMSKKVKAPVRKGDKVGEISYYMGDNLIGTVQIVAKESVQKSRYMDYLKNLWYNINLATD